MKYFIYLFISILLIGIVSAAPPFEVTGTGADGLSLNMPIEDFIKKDLAYDVNVHVFNLSTGMPVYATTIQCNLHLYNSSGDHVYSGTMVRDLPADHGVTNEWVTRLTGTNFSKLGLYRVMVQCNNSVLGGGIQKDFEVTQLGTELTTSKTYFYVLIFIFSLIVLASSLTISIMLPYDNKRDEVTGYIISLSYLKYLKIVFIGITYLIFYFITYYSYTLSYAFLEFSYMTQIFYFLFIAMSVLILPFYVLLAYLLFANGIRDSEIGDFLERGLEIK